jgi:hypothetical protein
MKTKKSRPNIVALYLYIFFSSIVQGGGHVSKIENLKERFVVVNHRWQSEATVGLKGA